MQDGLVSLRQCLRYGLSGQQANEAVSRGVWRRVVRGVYDLSGLVPMVDRNEFDRGRRRAALLGSLAYPGAIVTGVCALVLHGIQGAPTEITPEVTFPDGAPRWRRPGVRLRRTPLDQWAVVNGVPVASAPDALAQAVPELDRRHSVALMDSAQQQRRLTSDGLRQAHALAGRRPGVARTHRWWDESDARAESPAETWARLACWDAGIPPDMLQLTIVGLDGRLRARVDLAWLLPDGRWLLVEIDGREVHEAPVALFHDRTRQNQIATDQTLIRRFTGRDAWRSTLTDDLTSILRAVNWHPGRPCPSQTCLS